MTRMSFALALLAVLLCVSFAVAADKPIVGDWNCVSTAPDGNEMAFTMQVREDGGKLVAKAAFADGGEIQLTDAKFEDGTFTFKATLDSGTYDVQMKVTGDKLEGTYKGADASGPIKGTRKA